MNIRTAALILLCAAPLSMPGADLPKGVTMRKDQRPRFSAQFVRELNIDASSLWRGEIEAQYKRQLKSEDPALRACAAACLVSFQTDDALRALLGAARAETNEATFNEMFDDIINISELLGFPPRPSFVNRSISAGREELRPIDEAYARVGYRDLIHEAWRKARAGGEQTSIYFVNMLTGGYHPELSGFLTEMLSDVNDAGMRQQLQIALLRWTGHDLSKESLASVKAALKSPDDMQPAKVAERYRQYLAGIGYDASSDTRLGLSILFSDSTKDEIGSREMAMRLLEFQSRRSR